MDITENEVFAAFGMEPEAASADNGANAAETAAETTETAATEPESGAEAPETGKEQSADERHANAARRRQQEKEAEIDSAVKLALQQAEERHAAELKKMEEQRAEQQKDFFRRAGLKNTITGAEITSMEEFDSWEKEFSDAKLQRDLKNGKVTKETIAGLIREDPTVRAAQEILDRQEESNKAQREAENRERIRAEIEEIGQIDPSIKSVDDLLKMETSKEFYDYVQQGLSFKDAYYLSNRQRLEQSTREAARTQAMTNSRGKDHLSGTTSGRGAGASSVPPGEMAMFKLINPTATPDEIQAYYNKYNKTK